MICFSTFRIQTLLISNIKTIDTEAWKKLYNECGGRLQSPINIDPGLANNVVFRPAFQFRRYDQALPFVMKNDGHSGIPLFNLRF